MGVIGSGDVEVLRSWPDHHHHRNYSSDSGCVAVADAVSRGATECPQPRVEELGF